MSAQTTILITGVSGFIGGALFGQLSQSRPVIGLSRSRWRDALPDNASVVEGNFASFEDLRQLDEYSIDGLVHMAAATGGCSEEEGLAVNVCGTRRLLRYLLDRGCRKFVLASSIAAAGCLQAAFLPKQIPVPDDYRCEAIDAYGFSKAMMEKVTQHFARVHNDADFINLRLGVVVDDEKWQPLHITASTPLDAPFAELARVYRSDVLGAIRRALDAPHKSGVRNYNVVGSAPTCDEPVVEVLRAFYKDRAEELDLSHYEQAGNEYSPLYAMEKIKTELGFAPRKSTQGN